MKSLIDAANRGLRRWFSTYFWRISLEKDAKAVSAIVKVPGDRIWCNHSSFIFRTTKADHFAFEQRRFVMSGQAERFWEARA